MSEKYVDRTLAGHLLGCQTRIVHGKNWSHRIIVYGTGAPLILLHGSNGHAEVFAKNLHSLGQEYRVIAVDALFHGFSSKGPWVDGYWKRIEVQAAGIVDLIDALGLTAVSIEGESMGAGIALEFAMQNPDRVRALILSTGFGSVDLEGSVYMTKSETESDFSRLSREAAVSPSRESMRRRMEWLVASGQSITDELVDIRLQLYSVPAIQESMKKMSAPGDDEPKPKYREEDLVNLKVPTMVMWTDSNPGDGAEIGERLAGLIPGARFELVRNAGHWPHWEQPRAHDELVHEFIESVAVEHSA